MAVAYKDGSTWRYPREIHYKDGTTWRQLFQFWVKDGSTWREISKYIGSITVGTDGTSYGFYQSLVVGSLSTTSFDSTHNISILSYESGGGVTLLRIVNGTLTGITQTNYIKDVDLAGTVVTTASASNFTNSGALVQWTWSGDPFGFASKNGQTISLQFTAA